MYQKYLEPIVEEFTTGEHYREVYSAKQEFNQKAGLVFDDDQEFEERMSVFMDWYLFDRDLPGVDLPPVKLYFKNNKDKFTEDDLNIYRDFCSTIHSIFRLKRKQWFGKGVIVTDLLTHKDYTVMDSEVNQGLASGDIFEARLIPFKDGFEFSKGFCFHPKEVEGFILSEIKKVRFQDKGRQNKLIHQLSSMKIKHLRFQHIDLKYIYAFDSRF